MSANQYVLGAGIRATRATFERWQRDPWPTLRRLGCAQPRDRAGAPGGRVGRLQPLTPDSTPVSLPGITAAQSPAAMLPILFRNSLVLALHATACVAGFIAGASMPIAAAQRTGFSRWVHVRRASWRSSSSAR